MEKHQKADKLGTFWHQLALDCEAADQPTGEGHIPPGKTFPLRKVALLLKDKIVKVRAYGLPKLYQDVRIVMSEIMNECVSVFEEI